MKLVIFAFAFAVLSGCTTPTAPTASNGQALQAQPLPWATGSNGMAD